MPDESDVNVLWAKFRKGDGISDLELLRLVKSATLLETHMRAWGKAGFANESQILHDRYMLEGFQRNRERRAAKTGSNK